MRRGSERHRAPLTDPRGARRAAALLALPVLLALPGAAGAGDDERLTDADFGWELRTLDGRTTTLERFRGRVLFINLRATWCPPCVAELRSIQTLADARAPCRDAGRVAAADAGGARTLLGGSLAYTGRVVDGNGDGFGDLPLMRRAALFGKRAGGTAAKRTLELSARYGYEGRANGVAGFTRADRGSDVRYGEAILTQALRSDHRSVNPLEAASALAPMALK